MMKKTILLSCISLLLAGNVGASMVDNSKVVDAYKTHKDDAEFILVRVQDAVQLSDAILISYKNIGITPTFTGYNRTMQTLREDATTLPFPFNSCSTLPNSAAIYFDARVDGLKKDNSPAIKSSKARYLESIKYCTEEINIPPQDKVEELGIIDVTS
ncbi:hypothetical protein DVQ60_03150 [Yersinia enterocolitica]|nr:hypothetical protein [Yersinia enterocolitica]